MNKPPLISIAILNYNGAKFLRKIIPSIIKINYSNFEIIAVDNNSKDDSIKFLESLNNKKIKIIKNHENSGYSKGKNLCVENCNGEYILSIDEDMKVLDTSILNALLDFYEKKEDIAFLSPLFRDIGSKKTKYYGIYSSWYGLRINNPKTIEDLIKNKKDRLIGAYHGGAVFFKKNIWKELGGYSQIQKFMLDDFDLGFRAYTQGYKNYLYFKEELITHLGKNKDNSKKKFAWKYNYYLSGVSIMMIKNYNLKNLIIRIPTFLVYTIVLYSGLAIIKKNIFMILSFFLSFSNLIRGIMPAISERKIIQNKRKTKEDSFLKIKPEIN